MNLLIDGFGLTGKNVFGIHRYALEILRAMDGMITDEAVELAVPNYTDEHLITERLSFSRIEVVKIGDSKKRTYKYGHVVDAICWREITFPRYAKKQNAVMLDMMLDFPRTKVDVITIHDCIMELCPPAKPSLRYKMRVLQTRFLQKRGIRNCKTLLTVSEYSKQDIKRVYNTKGKRIVVVPNAWQHFQHITEDDGIIEKLSLKKKQYFFSLGSRLHHKNAKWILSAAEENPQYTFVISGSSFNHLDQEAQNNKAENVIFTGYLRDSEVKALMRHCRAFIQPSLYEGFGIPPMEAMSVGADCIVSNATALPEIYNNSVWYINPYDYDNIDLDEIMSGPKESNDLILNEYSWEKSAKIVFEVIKELARQTKPLYKRTRGKL